MLYKVKSELEESCAARATVSLDFGGCVRFGFDDYRMRMRMFWFVWIFVLVLCRGGMSLRV